MERPPFPTVIDSSFLSAIRACGAKGMMEYLLHYKSKQPNIHLHAGKAFAHGAEVARKSFYEQELDPVTSVGHGIAALFASYGNFECPEDSAKSAERMAGALEYMFDQWPLGQDTATPIHLPTGKRGIEFSFLEPIDYPHPETGEPLLFSGRFDQIVDFAAGTYGEDDKTTKALGASWPKQWDLRSQFTAYCWGAQRGGIPLQGFLVRGIAILKTKYEVMQCVTARPQWMIDRWYEQVLRDLAYFQAQWEQGVYNYNLDHSCEEYGGCMFKTICQARPEDRDGWFQVGFDRRRWDPVTREEYPL